MRQVRLWWKCVIPDAQLTAVWVILGTVRAGALRMFRTFRESANAPERPVAALLAS
jgi:hypothetical protein